MNQAVINDLLQSLKSLQESSEYSDLKITCGDEVFSVHKAVVCPRSEFFSKACSWAQDEQPKGEIALVDDGPKIVKLMIDYLYRLDYDEFPRPIEDVAPVPVQVETVAHDNDDIKHDTDDPFGFSSKKLKNKKAKKTRSSNFGDPSPTGSTSIFSDWPNGTATSLGSQFPESSSRAIIDKTPVATRLQDLSQSSDAQKIIINTHLYALADKYGVQNLKDLAKSKFVKAIERNWKSEAFVHASQLVFENTPSNDLGLRSVVVDTLRVHPELIDYEEVQELLDSGNGIAWQLVKALLAWH